jgi:hypothetical protein
MTRLTFRFSPRDTTDFDVCAGPARPPAPPAREDRPAAEPAAAAPRATDGGAASRGGVTVSSGRAPSSAASLGWSPPRSRRDWRACDRAAPPAPGRTGHRCGCARHPRAGRSRRPRKSCPSAAGPWPEWPDSPSPASPHLVAPLLIGPAQRLLRREPPARQVAPHCAHRQATTASR